MITCENFIFIRWNWRTEVVGSFIVTSTWSVPMDVNLLHGTSIHVLRHIRAPRKIVVEIPVCAGNKIGIARIERGSGRMHSACAAIRLYTYRPSIARKSDRGNTISSRAALDPVLVRAIIGETDDGSYNGSARRQRSRAQNTACTRTCTRACVREVD